MDAYKSFDGRAEDFDAVAFQNARLVQGNAAVEGRLTAKRQHDAIRSFLFNHILDILRRNLNKTIIRQ